MRPLNIKIKDKRFFSLVFFLLMLRSITRCEYSALGDC